MNAFTIYVAENNLFVKPDTLSCRTCLTTARKLRNLTAKMCSIITEVIGCKVELGDALPQYLCLWCWQLLLKYDAFRTTAKQAATILQNLKNTGRLGTTEIATNKYFTDNYGISKIELSCYNPDNITHSTVSRGGQLNETSQQLKPKLASSPPQPASQSRPLKVENASLNIKPQVLPQMANETPIKNDESILSLMLPEQMDTSKDTQYFLIVHAPNQPPNAVYMPVLQNPGNTGDCATSSVTSQSTLPKPSDNIHFNLPQGCNNDILQIPGNLSIIDPGTTNKGDKGKGGGTIKHQIENPSAMVQSNSPILPNYNNHLITVVNPGTTTGGTVMEVNSKSEQTLDSIKEFIIPKPVLTSPMSNNNNIVSKNVNRVYKRSVRKPGVAVSKIEKPKATMKTLPVSSHNKIIPKIDQNAMASKDVGEKPKATMKQNMPQTVPNLPMTAKNKNISNIVNPDANTGKRAKDATKSTVAKPNANVQYNIPPTVPVLQITPKNNNISNILNPNANTNRSAKDFIIVTKKSTLAKPNATVQYNVPQTVPVLQMPGANNISNLEHNLKPDTIGRAKGPMINKSTQIFNATAGFAIPEPPDANSSNILTIDKKARMKHSVTKDIANSNEENLLSIIQHNLPQVIPDLEKRINAEENAKESARRNNLEKSTLTSRQVQNDQQAKTHRIPIHDMVTQIANEINIPAHVIYRNNNNISEPKEARMMSIVETNLNENIKKASVDSTANTHVNLLMHRRVSTEMANVMPEKEQNSYRSIMSTRETDTVILNRERTEKEGDIDNVEIYQKVVIEDDGVGEHFERNVNDDINGANANENDNIDFYRGLLRTSYCDNHVTTIDDHVVIDIEDVEEDCDIDNEENVVQDDNLETGENATVNHEINNQQKDASTVNNNVANYDTSVNVADEKTSVIITYADNNTKTSDNASQLDKNTAGNNIKTVVDGIVKEYEYKDNTIRDVEDFIKNTTAIAETQEYYENPNKTAYDTRNTLPPNEPQIGRIRIRDDLMEPNTCPDDDGRSIVSREDLMATEIGSIDPNNIIVTDDAPVGTINTSTIDQNINTDDHSMALQTTSQNDMNKRGNSIAPKDQPNQQNDSQTPKILDALEIIKYVDQNSIRVRDYLTSKESSSGDQFKIQNDLIAQTETRCICYNDREINDNFLRSDETQVYSAPSEENGQQSNTKQLIPRTESEGPTKSKRRKLENYQTPPNDNIPTLDIDSSSSSSS